MEFYLLCKSYPTLRQARPRVGPEAAMRVRKISAQCVLQFTPSLAAGCVLHRPVSRVIHCLELYKCFGNLTIALLEFELFIRFSRRIERCGEMIYCAERVLRAANRKSADARVPTTPNSIGPHRVEVPTGRVLNLEPLFKPSLLRDLPLARRPGNRHTHEAPDT